MGKKRLSKWLILASAVMALVLVAAACAAEEEAEPETITVVETVIVEAPGEVVELVVPEFPPGTELKILQWSHFVPQYDKWIDPFAEAWGEANGVEVTVDHISLLDLPANLTAAIAAGEGPTIVEMLFAPSSFVEGLQDLTDVNLEAQRLFGEQADTCTASSFLPVIDQWYGFCHGWIPDPADYDSALWSQVGFPNGPSTWADLLQGGKRIKDDFGIPLGIGLSPELDSRMAARAIIWSFGGSVQDENENVVINSPEVIEAVEFMAQLFRDTMTDEVFAWNPASNNQGLIAGELSYILNSISAYRSLQDIDPAAADNIAFGPALKGPRGDQQASSHVWQIYVVPNYVQGAELEAAKAFMLHLTANYNQAVFNSKLYNFPAFPSTVPQLGGWVENDPFGSRPADKLALLATAEDWTAHIGWPGPANPAVGEVFGKSILANMMAQVARGDLTAEEAVADAEAQIKDIFDFWREKGLVGGG